jgi:DNA-binding transcriptional regulator YbjK
MASWGSRRRRPAREPRARADHQAVATARSARRTALIREALAAPGGSPLTHEWLAERTGVPLGYLRWRFPAVDDLLRELGGS